jgi:prepilin-type processing-associated H-X9-DG protein
MLEFIRMLDADAVLSVLDEIEGYRSTEPDASLYIRTEAPVTFADGHVANAWVYFYNAPLGKAERIESGDYLAHLRVK